jgi:hypothetical protein
LFLYYDLVLNGYGILRHNKILLDQKQGLHSPLRTTKRNPDTSKDNRIMLSLPKARKIPKVTEPETIHATVEQQEEEMERLLKNFGQ